MWGFFVNKKMQCFLRISMKPESRAPMLGLGTQSFMPVPHLGMQDL